MDDPMDDRIRRLRLIADELTADAKCRTSARAMRLIVMLALCALAMVAVLGSTLVK